MTKMIPDTLWPSTNAVQLRLVADAAKRGTELVTRAAPSMVHRDQGRRQYTEVGKK